jgi:hypothetical protein
VCYRGSKHLSHRVLQLLLGNIPDIVRAADSAQQFHEPLLLRREVLVELLAFLLLYLSLSGRCGLCFGKFGLAPWCIVLGC